MILWDVNILVYAFRHDSPYHRQSRQLIADTRGRGEPFLTSALVAASFVRLVTNDRIFSMPSASDEAWRFLGFLEADSLARFAAVDSQVYSIFRHLCLTTNARGNRVPDALLAALAIRNGTRFVTGDRGFDVFAGLDLEVIDLVG